MSGKKLDEYQRGITAGLDRAYAADSTETEDFDIDAARIIVFSDHHKGGRDGADDFLRCEPAYAAALGYYLEAGYRLIVLGDAEELWECKADEVLRSYAETLRLEAEFHKQGRYERFWGNHDDVWHLGDEVEKHLGPIFPGLRVREALKLRAVRQGQDLGVVFLVHGHQGTLDSDRYSWFSRVVVRNVWRPLQRRLKIPSTTPARDFELRERHDAAMFEWSRTHGDRVLIAGHTHRPVFGTSQPPPKVDRGPAEIERELEEERANPSAPDSVAKLRGELELARGVARRADRPALPISPPCYFNTGCCSFGDGDVTGLELIEGQIRLVRWLSDDYKALPKVLASADLAEVLKAVGSGSGG